MLRKFVAVCVMRGAQNSELRRLELISYSFVKAWPEAYNTYIQFL